jgi:type VI secretion system protein VasG
MQVALKPLFARLNGLCKTALEGAAGLALSRGHYEIGVAHLLRRLLDDAKGDVPLILHHFDVDPLKLTARLDEALASMPSGNSGRPVFAPFLTQWVQESWLASSISLGQVHIRSAALLLALVTRLDYYGSSAAWADTLKPIKTDALERDALSIIASSVEAEVGTSAEGQASSGAASTGAIDRFCEDFTAKAAAGRIDPVFGRDDEIRQMIDILARRRKNNPICVGDPGVGKTAVVEGLALRIIEGDVPDFLRQTRLLGLDLGLLEAGASVKGEFEQRLRGVIDEIKASTRPIILFIDEAHMLVGAGGAAGGNDAANLLKPALARGELRTVAATTWAEYKKYFEKDPALARRFQLVKLDEPDVATAIQILRGVKDRYEAEHGVIVRDEAVVAAVELSDRYITGRLLPDKAVDLLDTAAARVRISQAVKPAELERIERRLAGLAREQEALLRDDGHGHEVDPERLEAIANEILELDSARTTLTTAWQAEQAAAHELLAARAKAADAENTSDEINAARSALHALRGEAPMVFTEVDRDAVAQVVSDWTGVPLGKMLRNTAGGVLGLQTRLAERIHGQDHALAQISDALKAAQSGLRDPSQPLGVFLLVGPSGVGKTETALAVADQLFGGEQALTVVNMSEYQEKHTISRLVGSPPGYVGYGEGGVLTEAVRKRPYCVVLLDEVEKAHLDVVNLFYQVFDKGTLADGEGRLIDFSNTVVFLTSNLATDEITAATTDRQDLPEADALADTIRPTLSRHFKPALLARMTVVPYFSLAGDALRGIVEQKIARMAARLEAANRCKLDISDAVIDSIANQCTQVETGARNIDFILRRSLLPALSDCLLRAMATQQTIATLKADLDEQGELRIEVLEA